MLNYKIEDVGFFSFGNNLIVEKKIDLLQRESNNT